METQYPLEYLVCQIPAQFLLTLHVRHIGLKIEGMGGVPLQTGQASGEWSGTAGTHPSIPQRYRSSISETDIGGGRKKVKQRINVLDLWDNPGLIKQINSEQMR